MRAEIVFTACRPAFSSNTAFCCLMSAYLRHKHLKQGSQTHLGVRVTQQDFAHSVGRIVFTDDKMQ